MPNNLPFNSLISATKLRSDLHVATVGLIRLSYTTIIVTLELLGSSNNNLNNILGIAYNVNNPQKYIKTKINYA